MLSKVNFLYLFLISLILSSCASVGTPEGGAKDEVPPKLVESKPNNRAINVKGNVLELTFDEEIQVKDINRQLLITPNTNNTFQATAKKENLRLEFEKPFEPNTTYFINFRGAVTDVTESNKPQNLTLTFSTGTYIDSGQVSGTVKDLYTNNPEKNINVALYAARDTTSIRKHKPYYFTQTDDKGNFLLQNIKFGEYRILAHQDKNNNLIYDNENEKIAYQKNFVNITSTTPAIILNTLKVDTRKPIVEASEKFTNEYRLTLSEGIQSLKIVPLTAPSAASPFINIISKNGQTAVVYPTAALPKADYIITAIDSSNNIGIDTLNISFEGKKAPRAVEAFKVKTTGGQLTKEEPLQLNFSVPIKVVQPQALTIVEDSVNRRALSMPQDFTLNNNATTLTLTQPLKAQKTLAVILDTTKILPVFGDPFRRQSVRMPISNKIALGTIISKINASVKRYWVEVMTENYQVLITLDSPKELKLDKIEPGKYYIRVKIDEDNDGKWRAGNTDLLTPAERIYHYPAVLEIRADWEIVLDPPLTF